MIDLINTDLIPPILALLILLILLWWVTSYLNAKRISDRERRDKRIPYLIDTYRRLVRATQSNSNQGMMTITPELESAIVDIQLFGRRSQVKKAKEFTEALKEGKGATLDSLLSDIRDELRSELRLAKIRGPIFKL